MNYTLHGDIFYFDAMFSDEMELLILIYCQIRSRVGRGGEGKRREGSGGEGKEGEGERRKGRG